MKIDFSIKNCIESTIVLRKIVLTQTLNNIKRIVYVCAITAKNRNSSVECSRIFDFFLFFYFFNIIETDYKKNTTFEITSEVTDILPNTLHIMAAL